jgi:hypothetical protein
LFLYSILGNIDIIHVGQTPKFINKKCYFFINLNLFGAEVTVTAQQEFSLKIWKGLKQFSAGKIIN